MTAEVGQRCNGWLHSDLPYNDHCTQDASVQQMVLDHGSVSFGRFAAESLSWEKRSVFADSNRQEEIRKLTRPGLVAQKKAFFEEYYKSAKHLKAQATNQTDTQEGNQEDKLPAVVSQDQVDRAPSSSFVPSTGVTSSDKSEFQDPHGIGYVTFNPLFSQITGLQKNQQEDSKSCQNQHADTGFPSLPHTNSKHVLNREALTRKILAPKHIVSNENGESNAIASKIILPLASVKSGGLKVDLENNENQKPRKNVESIGRSTKRYKGPSTSLTPIPRVDSRRNSENTISQDLNDPFHKRVEMKLRALSDRLNADRAATSSRSTLCQNVDRVTTSSRSTSCQNADRVYASSKSTAQASHKPLKEVQRAPTVSRANFFNKGSQAHVSHVASSNSSATRKLAAKCSIGSNLSKSNANAFQTAQVTTKRASGLTTVSSRAHNKRKQRSTPATLDENNLNREFGHISAPPSARSSSDSLLPCKTAKAPKISYGNNVVIKKSSHPPVRGRNALPKHAVNCNEQKRKVNSSHSGNLSSSTRNNLTCGLSLSKNKPRQERPRWR